MDEERVEYSFTGDVTSLRQATQQAISLLDKYDVQLKTLANNKGFDMSTKGAMALFSGLKSTSKAIEDMKQKLKGVTDVPLYKSAEETQRITTSITQMRDGLNHIQSATKLSSEEAQSLADRMQNVTQALRDSAKGVDTMVAKEEKFQHVIDGVSAKSQKLKDLLLSMKNRVSGIFDPMLQKLNSLKNPYAQVVHQTQVFKDKSAEAFRRVSQLAAACASAFRRVQQSEEAAGDAASRSSRFHDLLANTLNRLRGLFKREAEDIDTEKEKLDKKSKSLKDSTNRHSRLRDALNRLGMTFRSESLRISSFTNNLNLMTRATELARRGLWALVGIRVGEWLASAVKESINFVENLNLFTVAMGDSIDRGLKFVDTMSEIYGMDPSNLYRYSGYFYQLTDAIGMADSASATLSLSLTKASNDIASLFNVDIQTVVDNLASGMQGMSRAVRKYGMDIRSTTLQQTALNYGITGQVENMSEANRMALRYLTMMEQVKAATQQLTKTTDGATVVMGDFARTIETPANQLRIFKEQMTQLGRSIGNFFIPALQTALPLLNGFIMALRTILTFLATLVGYTTEFGGGVADMAESIKGIGSAAAGTAKKMKNLVAPFDELNILTQNQSDDTGGIGSDILDPKLQAAIEGMELNLENIEMQANKVRDSLLNFFGFDYVSVFNPDTGEYEKQLQWFADQFQNNLVNKFPQWSKTINALFDNWNNIMASFGKVFKSIGGVIDKARDKLKELTSTLDMDSSFATFIEGLSGGLDRLSQWIDAHADELADLVLTISALVVAFKTLSALGGAFKTISATFSVLSALVAPVGAAMSGLVGTLGALSAPALLVAAGIAAVVGALVYLWSTSDSFRKSVTKGVESLMDILNNLWTDVLKPIGSNIGSSLAELWTSAIQPIIMNVIGIIGDLVELLMALWNNVVAPLINWLVDVFGPLFADVFNSLWNIVSAVIGDIVNIIDGLLLSLDGLIDFLVGVFTGDWQRAWKGIVNIFWGIGNTLISIFELVMNSIIGLVNTGISFIFNGIKSLINSVLGAVEGVADMLDYDLDIQIGASAPQIPRVSIPRIPALASGAVVKSPTVAMVGEGRYDEAVIPLGNSPQLSDMIDRIVDAIDRKRPGDDDRPIDVHVYIDSDEVTTAQNRKNMIYGKTRQKV